MKYLLLTFVLLMGCASEPIVNEYGDTAHQAQVRVWLNDELFRIYQKREIVNDMFKTGEITYPEYFRLLEECDEEKRTILQRLPEHLKVR